MYATRLKSGHSVISDSTGVVIISPATTGETSMPPVVMRMTAKDLKQLAMFADEYVQLPADSIPGIDVAKIEDPSASAKKVTRKKTLTK